MNTETTSRLACYLSQLRSNLPDAAAVAYYASLDKIESVSPTIANAIAAELYDQRQNIKLIASENYCSLATQLAHGNLLTDKYAEGYPGHRFYAGCDNVDTIETEAAELAKTLFGADHAYVQPHSGVDANFTAIFAVLYAKIRAPYLAKLKAKRPEEISRQDWQRLSAEMTRQKLVGMDYYSGGHLTHGYRFNVTSHLFDIYSYSVDRNTLLLDLDSLWQQLKEIRPLILLAGYSAYSRSINFAKLRQMADDVGAVLWVDMAHFAGLVAGKVFTGELDPVAHADIVTSTTHKTLRGPRGGFVLCRKAMAEWVDKGCPTNLGGPLPHAMAAKAIAFREASDSSFQTYAHGIVTNARTLAEACLALGLPVLTGGTDNHMILIDVDKAFGLTGRQAESALRSCGITVNRNALPFDRNGPWFTSGLRIGTAAVTTLGMGPGEMREIANIMHSVLAASKPMMVNDKVSLAKVETDAAKLEDARARTRELLGDFPVYPELNLDIVLKRSSPAAA